MPVKLQKFVMVSNPRVECLYYLACSMLTAMLIYKFIDRQEYLEFIDTGAHVHTSIWPAVMNTTAELESYYRDQRETCDGLDGMCLPPCHSESNNDDICAFAGKLGFSISSEEVMFITSVAEEDLADGRTTITYAPYEETYALMFSFSWLLPPRMDSPVAIHENDHTGPWPNARYSSQHHTRGGLLPLILDRHGQVYRIGESHDGALLLSMSEIFELAGLPPDWLDQEQNSAGVRGGDHVIGRLSGIELSLSVRCYDKASAWQFASSEVYDRADQEQASHFCEVSIVPSSERSSRRDSDFHSRQFRTMLHGIHITAQTGGHTSRLNFVNIYNAVVQAYVLSMLPKFFVLIFVTRMLGHLSAIYRRFIFEIFDIAEQVAGTAVRLMSHSVTFEDLCEHGEAAITKETLYRRVKESIGKTDILDEEELQQFVDFSHKAILDLMHYVRHDRLSEAIIHDIQAIGRKVGRRIAPTVCKPRQSVNCTTNLDDSDVDMGSFVAACSSIDKVTLHDTVQLFNHDRNLGILEAFFMPRYLRQLIRLSQLGHWRPQAQKSPSSLKIEFATCPSDSDSPVVQHATTGTKAYQKVLDLEAHLERRHTELEQMAKGRVPHKHLERTVRRILFPDDASDDGSDACSQPGSSPQDAQSAISPASEPQEDKKQVSKQISNLLISRKDAEAAMSLAQAEMMDQVAELVNCAVKDATANMLVEVEGAIIKAQRDHWQKCPCEHGKQRSNGEAEVSERVPLDTAEAAEDVKFAKDSANAHVDLVKSRSKKVAFEKHPSRAANVAMPSVRAVGGALGFSVAPMERASLGLSRTTGTASVAACVDAAYCGAGRADMAKEPVQPGCRFSVSGRALGRSVEVAAPGTRFGSPLNALGEEPSSCSQSFAVAGSSARRATQQ